MTSARSSEKRRRSIQNIGKVTRAMAAVSASRLRQAQKAALASRPYAEQAAEVLAYLRAESVRGVVLHPLLTSPVQGVPAVVVVSPDRGLTGGLVLQILRAALERGQELGPRVAWVSVGRRADQFLRRYVGKPDANYVGLRDSFEPPSPEDVVPSEESGEWETRDDKRRWNPVQVAKHVGGLVVSRYKRGLYSSVHIAYARYESPTYHPIQFSQLLPIRLPDAQHELKGEFTFEPSAEALLDYLLPKVIVAEIYQALIDAKASEHSARMIAMQQATDVVEELEHHLRLEYNKARQSEITSELLDIVGGAEALRRR